jgi:hypothetical protein
MTLQASHPHSPAHKRWQVGLQVHGIGSRNSVMYPPG